MFRIFKKTAKINTAEDQVFGDVELEDLTVTFNMVCGQPLIKDFVSYASFYPAASYREDGVCIGDMDDRLAIFMERWKSNEFAVIGDTIAVFSHFVGASIARKKRIVRVRVRRTCVA